MALRTTHQRAGGEIHPSHAAAGQARRQGAQIRLASTPRLQQERAPIRHAEAAVLGRETRLSHRQDRRHEPPDPELVAFPLGRRRSL